MSGYPNETYQRPDKVIRVAEIHWDLLITELWLDIIQHTCDILWLVHFWVQTLKLSRLLVLLVLKSQIGNHQPPSLFEFFMHLPAALWDMRHRPNSDLCKSIYNHKFDRSGRNIRKLCHFLSHINFLCMWVIHTVLSRIDHERSHCDFSQVHHPGLGDWLGEHFSFGASAPLLRSRATDRWCRWMAGEWLSWCIHQLPEWIQWLSWCMVMRIGVCVLIPCLLWMNIGVDPICKAAKPCLQCQPAQAYGIATRSSQNPKYHRPCQDKGGIQHVRNRWLMVAW